MEHQFRSGLARLSPYWLHLLAIAVIVPLYVINSLRFTTPVGYAGLFSLFSDALRQNNLSIPYSVPYYGPGGTPFAYPPVGFYIAAIITSLTRISMFQFLRWAPPLYTLLAFIAMYYFFKKICKDPQKAVFAVLLVACSEITYTTHATAAGMVRGLALLFSMLSSLFAWKAFYSDQFKLRECILSAAFLGLTFLTHLSYGVFVSIGIVVMAIWRDALKITELSIRTIGFIGLINSVVIAPWLIYVNSRYGLPILLGLKETHGTLGVLDRTGGTWWKIPIDVGSWFLNLGRTWSPYLLSGLAVLALLYCIKRGRMLIPAWMILTSLILGEADRFGIILAGMLIAELIFDLVRETPTWKPQRIMSVGFIQSTIIVLVLSPIVWHGVKAIPRTKPTLGSSVLDLATWVRENTLANSTYLFLEEGHDTPEWMPYLLQRTPLVAHWGSEWTGVYQAQLTIEDELHRCLDEQSFRCILDMVYGRISMPDFIILPSYRSELASQISTDPGWDEIFSNSDFIIFQHIG